MNGLGLINDKDKIRIDETVLKFLNIRDIINSIIPDVYSREILYNYFSYLETDVSEIINCQEFIKELCDKESLLKDLDNIKDYYKKEITNKSNNYSSLELTDQAKKTLKVIHMLIMLCQSLERNQVTSYKLIELYKKASSLLNNINDIKLGERLSELAGCSYSKNVDVGILVKLSSIEQHLECNLLSMNPKGATIFMVYI